MAVSTSPIADELLAAMATGGVTGLALWPEDLQHLISTGCPDLVTSPDQLVGTTIRIAPSQVTEDIAHTLATTPEFDFDSGADFAACKLRAVVAGLHNAYSLPGLPTYTGDITLYSKFDVLAANSTALGRLTASQQQMLRAAALAARDRAIAEFLPDAEAAAAWCAQGGTVVLAGPAGVAAFAAALQPVTDRLMADPVAAKAIDAIRVLKSTVTPAPGAAACSPTPAQTAPAFHMPSTTGYVGTIPPDGTYRADITVDSLLANGASAHFAEKNRVLATLTFKDGASTWVAGQSPPCDGDVTSDGKRFAISERVPDTCIGGYFVWRDSPDGIDLVWLPPTDGSWPVQDIIDVSAYFDRTWTRID